MPTPRRAGNVVVSPGMGTGPTTPTGSYVASPGSLLSASTPRMPHLSMQLQHLEQQRSEAELNWNTQRELLHLEVAQARKAAASYEDSAASADAARLQSSADGAAQLSVARDELASAQAETKLEAAALAATLATKTSEAAIVQELKLKQEMMQKEQNSLGADLEAARSDVTMARSRADTEASRVALLEAQVEAGTQAWKEVAAAKLEIQVLRKQDQNNEMSWSVRLAEAEAVFLDRAEADSQQLDAALASEIVQAANARKFRDEAEEAHSTLQDVQREHGLLQDQLARLKQSDEFARRSVETLQNLALELRSEVSSQRIAEEAARAGKDYAQWEADTLRGELEDALAAQERAERTAKSATQAAQAAAAQVDALTESYHSDIAPMPLRQSTEPSLGSKCVSSLPALPFQVELLRAATEFQQQCEELNRELAAERERFRTAARASDELRTERGRLLEQLGAATASEEGLQQEVDLLRSELEAKQPVNGQPTVLSQVVSKSNSKSMPALSGPPRSYCSRRRMGTLALLLALVVPLAARSGLNGLLRRSVPLPPLETCSVAGLRPVRR